MFPWILKKIILGSCVFFTISIKFSNKYNISFMASQAVSLSETRHVVIRRQKSKENKTKHKIMEKECKKG